MQEPQLLSQRLSLRLVNNSDLENIHELHSLPETDRYNTLGIPQNVQETESIIKSWIAAYHLRHLKEFIFVIEQTSDRQFIGLIALKLGSSKFKTGEVWYKLHAKHWGQGFATEALNAVLEFGFQELQLHRIEAGCAVDNIGSIKVLEKVGMTREGRKRKVLPLKTGWSDNFEYAILEEDYKPKN